MYIVIIYPMPEFKEYCKKCPLPDLYNAMNANRLALETANANIKASDSPTQAEPYIQIANDAKTMFELYRNEYGKFAKTGKKCQSCPI